MYYENKIWFGDADGEKVVLLPKMANRHGLIAGATGTGKTVTLKVLAESFSEAGVPVFMSDAKGDLSGICKPGADSADMQERISRFGLNECGFSYQSYPAVFWDIFGKTGIPLRTTISEMGPILMAKLMDLNETQSDILTCLFKMADDRGLLLVDIKDLKAILQYASDNAEELSKEYGNMNKTSIAAIIRNVVALEAAGGDKFYSEPAINVVDFFANASDGKGTINILDGTELANDPTMYSAFLLYLMSELFETLPEVGDMDKPRLVFFFDEAHLIFKDISKALANKIEQVIKLIRSKGVGIYFITQSPKDIPDAVLAQLGNKIQHALRAYTPAEEKAVKIAADSFRANPAFSTKEVITSMGVGEALVSVLDENGVPTIVQRTKILPPKSYIGNVEDDEKLKQVVTNNLYLKYKDTFETDSAYEFLQRQNSQKEAAEAMEKAAEAERLAKEKAEAEAEKEALAAQKAAEKEALAAQKAKEKEEAEALKAKEKEEAAAKKAAEKEALAAQKAAEKEALAAQKAAEKEALAAQKAAEKEALAAQKAAEKAEAKKKQAYKTAAKNVASTTAGSIGRELGKSVGKSIGGDMGKTIGGNIGATLTRSIMGTFFK